LEISIMKKFSTLALVAVAGLAFVGGCAKNTKNEGSMGSVGKDSCSMKSCSEKATCTDKKAEGSMGAVGEKKSCTEKAACTDKKAEGSMGAVSEKKSCSAKASSCSAKTTNN
jgi:hypothetical protein